MATDDRINWEQFLTPDILRNNLIFAGVYLVAFELLKDSVIGRIKTFYISGFDKDGIKTDPEYNNEVLSRSKYRDEASLLWLKDNGVINDDDIVKYNNIRRKRNKIAHEICKLSYQGIKEDMSVLFGDIFELLNKVEKWWILNVDIATDPELSDKIIDADGVIPGPILGLKVLIDVALGNDEESKFYIEKFNQKRGT